MWVVLGKETEYQGDKIEKNETIAAGYTRPLLREMIATSITIHKMNETIVAAGNPHSHPLQEALGAHLILLRETNGTKTIPKVIYKILITIFN